jgi:hypothetical protein
MESCAPANSERAHPCVRLGAALGELARRGRDKVTFIISPPVSAFGDWVEQLVAESTGKMGRGIVPIVGEHLGVPGSYGSDRVFVRMELGQGEPRIDARLRELQAVGHPLVTIGLRDRYDLGAMIYIFEVAVAIAGHLLRINPFDQPNVESAKVQARRMVERYVATGRLPEADPARTDPGELRRFLSAAVAGDYIAIQAYLKPSYETAHALSHFRHLLRDTTGLATTVGYGPRFLHSTGQLHKGDGGSGLFIQLTADDDVDAAIPDEAGKEASSITFGVLKMAQVMGDRHALLEAGRRVIHFHLGPDPASAILSLSGGER